MASALPAYAAIVRSRVAAQATYRTSFAAEVAGQVFLTVVEFAEVYVIFSRVEAVGGFSYAEVALLFGLAATGFSLADLVVGQVEHVSRHVRDGSFDVFLLRPLSTLAQLASSEFQLRRVGRLAQALVILVVAVAVVDVDWTPARVLLAVLTPLMGAVVFAAIFVATAAVSFWLVEGQEAANAFTYGGNYLSSWPFDVFAVAVRSFFTFVVPTAFVAYVPTLGLLGRAESSGFAPWLPWCTPLVALLTCGVAALVWRTGVRHYVGTGS